MAKISVDVSGTVTVSALIMGAHPCMSLLLNKDTLHLHGTVDDVRVFCQTILEKLPVTQEALA